MENTRVPLLLLLLSLLATGCGGGSSSNSTSPQTPSTPPANVTVPEVGHVVIVLEENHSYSSVIGNPVMPFFNSLASKGGVATNYFANFHPSIGNYFMLTTGQMITSDDNYTGTVDVDNIVRELLLTGKTWKSYAEDLPSVGYTGGDTNFYLKHHNPFAYLSDVVNSSVQVNNLVPFSPNLATDLTNNHLPNFSFIIPNSIHSAHNCDPSSTSCTDADELGAADKWLQVNLQPLLSAPAFQKDGLLIIVFDESFNDGPQLDNQHGGGHVALVMVGPKVNSGFQSKTFYQHQSTLRLLVETTGAKALPGAASTAPDMGEFFK
jgi:acid phosphatase